MFQHRLDANEFSCPAAGFAQSSSLPPESRRGTMPMVVLQMRSIRCSATMRYVWHAGGEEHGKYKQQVVEMLKAGQLVVQMLAAEETITMPDGSRKATFTQETWDMVSLTLQAKSSVIRKTGTYNFFHPPPGPHPQPHCHLLLGFWQLLDTASATAIAACTTLLAWQ